MSSTKGKKVPFGAKPRAVEAAADAWVQDREAAPKPEKEKMRRLTIDVPDELHRRIKMQCAMRGNKIADEVRELLWQKYGDL